MADEEVDEVRAGVEKYIGQPMGPPGTAPDEVNVPMIHHWVDALDDRNPAYEDPEVAREKILFDNLTPLYPEDWLKLEVEESGVKVSLDGELLRDIGQHALLRVDPGRIRW